MGVTDRLAADDVIVLDGGLATELERRGHDLSDDLWSAGLLVEQPAEIVETHLTFFRAGARVATTASYQASFEGFAARGIGRAEGEALLRRSVTLAREAVERYAGEDPDAAADLLVAASVGPYGAMLADGSEYSGDYGVPDRVLRDFHRPRMAVLADAGADLLALETVPSVQEAGAMLGVLDELPEGTQAWLSFTCADARRTRRGDDVADAFALAAASPRVCAVGVNCTAPEHAADLVAVAAGTGKPVVVYPNSGEGWDGAARRWTGAASVAAGARAQQWVAAGARLVGGCCRVTPAQIADISGAVTQ
ncbi:MAG: homocysteine S-methyltransferase [Nocardioidaceae bacterium]